jgi:D-Tyr-tRNAtyr deacylase
MFKNNPFEAATKAMMANAEKFMPGGGAGGDMAAPVMENLRAWGELMQAQAQAAQAAAAETMEDFKAIKDPQAAMEALKASAQKTLALTAKHLQEATALSVSQFTASVDAMQGAHPMAQAFAPVAKGMKTAASAMENAMGSALHKSASAAAPRRASAPAPAAKKPRSR